MTRESVYYIVSIVYYEVIANPYYYSSHSNIRCRMQ